jgi:serine/threonine protein kinase
MNFLRALKRTIKGDPYPALQGQSFAPISYSVANVSDPLVGVTLSHRYVVTQRIGSGSMSIVYSALQKPIDRIVAIKMLKREFLDEPLTVKRFYLEATAVSKLKHQNILTIHDVGETDEAVPYFVMEFLEGVSLSQLVEKYGAIHYLRALPIFAQICNAMAHAHRQGLIHRDLKPSNIMLTEEDGKQDFVKLVDFGIVLMTKRSQRISQRLTQKGEIWGSPFYMSPEQCTGSLIDHRSDIYSMGMVMYEILVGRPAFEEKNIGRIVNKHLKEMPLRFVESAPGKAIPESVEEVVFRCIQKNPDKRYQTMEELELALQALIPRRSNVSYHGLTPPAGIDLGNKPQTPPPRPARETTTEIPPFAANSGKLSNSASNSAPHNVGSAGPEKRQAPPLRPSVGSLSNSRSASGDQPLSLDNGATQFENNSMQSEFEDDKVDDVITRKKSFEEVKDTLRNSQPEQKSSSGIYVLIGAAVVVLLLFFGGIGFALTKLAPQFGDINSLINAVKTTAPAGTFEDRPGNMNPAGNINPADGVDNNSNSSNDQASTDNSSQSQANQNDAQNNNTAPDQSSSGSNAADSSTGNSAEQNATGSDGSNGENAGVTTAGVTLSGKPVTYPAKETAITNPSRDALMNTQDQSQNQNQSQNQGQSNFGGQDSARTQPVQQRTQSAVGQRAQMHSMPSSKARANPVRINRKQMSGPSDDDQIEQLYLKKNKHRGDAQQQWQDYSDTERSDDH